jgi:23S rRNA (guanine745-N1)-methyltransferase
VLERRGRTYACARHHSYDIARSGYVNLLQPTDRRSLTAGDTRDAIAARARLLDRGIGTTILNEVVRRAVTTKNEDDVVVDLGSGAGELLAAIAGRAAVTAVGIDLSTAAADHAARRYPSITWVVANADRRLPLLDRCVDVVVSLHGRRNPGECARCLTPAGLLMVAIPAADDLIELREKVLGEATTRERADALIAEHAASFEVRDQTVVRERHHATPEVLRDLLRGTYRAGRISEAQRIDTLSSIDVTLASEVIVFRRKPDS